MVIYYLDSTYVTFHAEFTSLAEAFFARRGGGGGGGRGDIEVSPAQISLDICTCALQKSRFQTLPLQSSNKTFLKVWRENVFVMCMY